jgi:acyl phosphate:glycerol-3-phosphate acyltransferase
MFLAYLGIAVLAYLIGAVPIGAIVAHFRGVDLWKYGSGKLGTTNVLRTLGRRAAAVVLLGDFLKGAVAVWLGQWITGLLAPGASVIWLDDQVSVLALASVIAAAAAICGHVWSIYMRIVTGTWNGGRGVATALGAILAVNPWICLITLLVAIPTIIISRYVSLGSILGAAAGMVSVLLMVLLGQMPAVALLFIGVGVFIIAAHRDNIERLLKGTERKLGEQVKV